MTVAAVVFVGALGTAAALLLTVAAAIAERRSRR